LFNDEFALDLVKEQTIERLMHPNFIDEVEVA
jgi:hypothetical protein